MFCLCGHLNLHVGKNKTELLIIVYKCTLNVKHVEYLLEYFTAQSQMRRLLLAKERTASASLTNPTVITFKAH